MKNWLIIFSIISAVGIFALPIFNLYVDQMQVFGSGYDYKRKLPNGRTVEINERWSVINFVKDNARDYDYIFGSSRVAALNPQVLPFKYLRLNYLVGLPQDHLHHLKYLYQTDISPSHIIIGLDRFSFYRNLLNNLRWQAHPSDLKGYISFYAKYLWKKPTSIDFQIFNGSVTTHRKNIEDIFFARTHNKNYLTPSKRIKKLIDQNRYKKLLKLSPLKDTLKYSQLRLDDTMDTIAKMKVLMENHGTDFWFYFNPHHYKNYLAMNHDELDLIYRELIKVTNFNDFMGLYPENMNNNYWRETSHFFTTLGDIVSKKLAKPKMVTEGFGKYLTPENIEAHLAFKRKLIHQNLVGLLLKDQKIIVHESLLTDKQNLLNSIYAGNKQTQKAVSESGVVIKGNKIVFKVSFAINETSDRVMKLAISVTKKTKLVTTQYSTAVGNKKITYHLKAGDNQIFVPIIKGKNKNLFLRSENMKKLQIKSASLWKVK